MSYKRTPEVVEKWRRSLECNGGHWMKREKNRGLLKNWGVMVKANWIKYGNRIGMSGKHHTKETMEKVVNSENFKKGLIKTHKILREKYSSGRLVIWNKGLTKETDERVRKYCDSFMRNIDVNVKKILSKVQEKPNNLEKRCGEDLERRFPGKFVYSGNGSVMINGRSPDYISEELNVVVLCNGIYWHLWIRKLEDIPENRQMIELKESEPYRKAGYEVWFYWEVLK